jgi:hypothetical protein
MPRRCSRTAVVVLVILVPLILISVKIVAEAASFYTARSQQWYNTYTSWPDASQHAAYRTGIPVEELKASGAARAQQFGAWLVDLVRTAARGMVSCRECGRGALLKLALP